MRTRILVTTGAAALVLMVAVWGAVLVAQAPSGTKAFDPTTTNTMPPSRRRPRQREAAAALKNWKPTRTPWGDPDLRGYWLLATYTPLERPAALGDKAFYTEEEAIAAVQERRRGRRRGRSANRALRLERVRHGRLAGRGQAEPAHLADRRSSGRADPCADAGGTAAARRRGCRRQGEKPGRRCANVWQHLHALRPRASAPRRSSAAAIPARSRPRPRPA